VEIFLTLYLLVKHSLQPSLPSSTYSAQRGSQVRPACDQRIHYRPPTPPEKAAQLHTRTIILYKAPPTLPTTTEGCARNPLGIAGGKGVSRPQNCEIPAFKRAIGHKKYERNPVLVPTAGLPRCHFEKRIKLQASTNTKPYEGTLLRNPYWN